MSNTMKAALIGGVIALIIMVLISGNITYDSFSPITTGNNNQITITTGDSSAAKTEK